MHLLFHFKQPGQSTVIRTGLFICLSTFLILFLLQPFGEVKHGFRPEGIARILSYGAVAGGLYIICDLFLRPVFQSLSFSEYKLLPALWVAVLTLIITTGIFLCKNLWMNFSAFSLRDYLVVLYRVFSIGLIPAAVFLVYLHLNPPERLPESIILLSSNEHNPEYLKLSASDLLVIQSDENYISVHYLLQGEVKKKLLRNTLSNTEQQLSIPFMRVHRSHIINLSKIQSVKGNSQGFTLRIEHLQEEYTVSRTYLPAFRKEWKQFSSE